MAVGAIPAMVLTWGDVTPKLQEQIRVMVGGWVARTPKILMGYQSRVVYLPRGTKALASNL